MIFNLSYSSLSLYRQSPRTFYYSYIKKLPPPDKTNQVYGKAGNVAHKALECYVQKIPFDAEKEWVKKRLDTEVGFNDLPLSFPIYKKCIDKGESVIDMYKELGYDIKVEEKFLFPYKEGINIKGFVDVVASKNDTIVLMDWKTNSSLTKGVHKEQRLFYCWLYYKQYGVIPKLTKWYYLKLDRADKDIFSLKHIQAFEKEMSELIDEIIAKGDNAEEYDIGDIDNPFNGYKSLMQTPIIKKEAPKDMTITIQNSKPSLKIEGELLDKEMKDQLSEEFSYLLKDAFFIKKHTSHAFDGYKKFFSVKKSELPIGFLDRLIRFFEDRKIKYVIIDKRIELRKFPMPSKMNGIILRDYQEKAVKFVMKNKITFLEIATSAGKTLIAAEIIRRNEGLTLFIVDRGILLEQTKKEFKDALNMDIGVITEGKIDLKVINIATIQTLNSLLDRKDKTLIKILANVKTLILDEGHTAAAKTFVKVSKYVINANIRLGMSGTFDRPDGNSMVIESVVGRPIFKIDAKEMIEKGHIMKPIIHFYEQKAVNCDSLTTYPEYYDAGIVDNENRNDKIVELVNQYKDKNVLILIHKINHGLILQERLEGSVFIKGDVDKEDRERWIEQMKRGEISTMIGTSSIVGKGLNIPSLDIIINATGNLSNITTIQSLGRILRKFKGKDRPIYIDFMDNLKHLKNHSYERVEILKQQGHSVEIK